MGECCEQLGFMSQTVDILFCGYLFTNTQQRMYIKILDKNVYNLIKTYKSHLSC